MRGVELILLCAGLGVVVTAELCADIDSNACALFVAAQPDYCSDVTAMRTCPRYCKQCPVECYNCNTTVQDFHECNTTMLCPTGQICMKKEMRSYVDGHHEYEMTCATKKACDGGEGLSIAFGKRGMKTRDISITCCEDDLCNYPEAITTLPPVTTSPKAVACKDILFLVDETANTQGIHHGDIINSIKNIVSQLDIGSGPHQDLVAVYGYDSTIRDHINLNSHTHKQDLLNSLDQLSLTSHHHTHADTSMAVHFLTQLAMGHRFGDRPLCEDVVIIIGDHDTMMSTHVSLSDRQDLIQQSQNIILVGIGAQSVLPLEHQLATDNQHIVNVPTANNLDQQLMPLITQSYA